MALTDSNIPPPASFEEARESADVSPLPADFTVAASIQSLARLNAEARGTLRTTAFLARSPDAALTLMAAAALVLVADYGTLRADFAWSLLLAAGIVAMTRNFIRGFARSLRRVPLQEAAADLRAILMFCGIVWGSGVFLVLPPAPPVLLAAAFALLPSLALTLVLRDSRGAVAFLVPAIVMTAGAAQAQFWPHAGLTTALVLILGAGIGLLAART